MPFKLSATALLLVALVVASPGAAAQAFTGRAFEPVVVTGEALTPLAGATPERIAAFRYNEGAWVPVPVQVDEREYLNIGWVYNGRDNIRCETEEWCFPYEPLYFTLYTDASTFIGADSDPFVDADDEVVFMAQDAGAQAPPEARSPDGVRGTDGVQVRVKDPVTEEKGYVYLFWQDGRYPADAGRSYVSYQFRLLSGDYQTTYDVLGVPYDNSQPAGDALGANPEDSEVVTAFYRRHFADRWIEDGLELRAGDATGVDLLDRWKIQYEPGDCRRSEYTASSARGAVVANRSGPVRAVRSIIGFNSGPLVQQDLFFYERYTFAALSVRTHPLGGVMAYTDYSPAADGMLHYSNVDPEGFIVDGDPEDAASGALEWDVLQGKQGTLVSSYAIVTDIPSLQRTSYYADEAPAQAVQCTGDAAVYGASGSRIRDDIPNTDPGRIDEYGEGFNLQLQRHQLYEAPAFPTDSVAAFIAAVGRPLDTVAEPYTVNVDGPPPPPPGSDPEGPIFLESPRPNPVQQSSRVTYWLAEDGQVSLAVYDALGRRVTTLDEGLRESGYHDVSVQPGRLADGIYFIRLDTPVGSRTVPLVRQ